MKSCLNTHCKVLNCRLVFAKSVWRKSKGKGKSGGARIITYNFLAAEMDGEIVLLLIYDKEDASSVKVDVFKQIVKEEGYPLEYKVKGCSI